MQNIRRRAVGGLCSDAAGYATRMHTPQPDDLAAWIDSHDPLPDAAAVEEVLGDQRAEHEPEDGPEVTDEGIAPLVNNTGHDGGAASG